MLLFHFRHSVIYSRSYSHFAIGIVYYRPAAVHPLTGNYKEFLIIKIRSLIFFVFLAQNFMAIMNLY